MSDWKKYRLSEIVTILSGGTPKTSVPEYWNGSIPWISITDFKNQKYVKSTEKSITNFGLENSSIELLQKGDIIISARGTVGELAVIQSEMAFNQSCYGLRAKEDIVNPEYLYYLLKQTVKAFKTRSYGSIFDTITLSTFNNIDVYLPSLEIQSNIAYALSVIDSKIENNNAINAELEALAKTIYDYWFLQFEFPNEEGLPYKSSGGKMVWSEELKREIPEGWEVKPLENLCLFGNGINYDKEVSGDKKYRIINVRNITASSILIDDSDLDEIILPKKLADRFLVDPDDILIARSGSPGAIRLLFETQDVIFCGFIIHCKPHSHQHRFYLMQYLKIFEGTNVTTSGGSILKNVSQDTLKSIYVPIPKESILEDYNTQVKLIFEMLHKYMKENRELAALRDWLLPMLMNGQVGFKEEVTST